jgi:photosystem II stability/assembly factor-like uncharacterized protein
VLTKGLATYRPVALVLLAVGTTCTALGFRVDAQEARAATDPFNQLKFRFIGPPGNRLDAIVGVPGNPYVYYGGAASGGIFKTSDGGVHWDPIFDAQPVASIGSLAVAPSDPNTVWAGTGESFIRSNISVGIGIYKSTDAGKTWTLAGLEKTGRIGRVVIDPNNQDNVLACALGHAYGPQPERGVFRTTDGGKTWARVLFVDENTGCSDLAMDPNNSRILFAGMWQIEIHTWGRTSGGPGSGLFKSTDGGATWKRLEGHGLPDSPVGKVAVAIARRNSSRVYAMIETGDGLPVNGKPTQRGQLWSTGDAGENWQLVSSDRQLRGRTHYYNRLAVAPDNENELFFMAAAFSRSLDGGRTLSDLPTGPGGDNHDMWIDPANGDRIIVVNDDGISMSINRGVSWSFVQLPIAQMYHVTLDNQVPYFVYGNRQDGPSYRGPSNSLEPTEEDNTKPAGRISRGVWHPVAGSEAGFATPDPVDNNIIWSSGTGYGSVGGAMARFDERNHQAREVDVWPEVTIGAPAADVKYRFNWEFPVTISPHDHNKVYVGSQFVHMTTDGGNSWQIISPDLTRNDKSHQQISGGLTPDNVGVEYADVVYAITESPKEPGVIWVGTNDGLVQLTRDGGKSWVNVTSNILGLPPLGTVDMIEASRYDAGKAYITVDFHQVNNRDPFVYKTTDYGKTWTLITTGIPHTMLSYAHCIREDPVRKGLLYLGTENALYVSFDDGAHWQPLQTNLPHAPVYWLALQEHAHDLVVATYGRGFWILDDLTPLEQLTDPVKDSASYLFAPRDAYRFRLIASPAAMPYDPSAGQNPPYGASIDYYLRSEPKDDVQVSVRDSSGHTVRTLKATKTAGVNRVWWDLRYDSTKAIRLKTSPLYAPDIVVAADSSRPSPGAQRFALLAPPGTYTLDLTVGNRVVSQKLTVLKDPHSTGTEGDVREQMKFMTALSGDMNTTVDCIDELESLRVQLMDFERNLGGGEGDKPIRAAADSLTTKLVDLESRILQLKNTGRGQDQLRFPPALVDRISYLAGQASSSDFPPTTQQAAFREELGRQVVDVRAQLRQVVTKDLAAFNAKLKQLNVPNIIDPTFRGVQQ